PWLRAAEPAFATESVMLLQRSSTADADASVAPVTPAQSRGPRSTSRNSAPAATATPTTVVRMRFDVRRRRGLLGALCLLGARLGGLELARGGAGALGTRRSGSDRRGAIVRARIGV